MDDIVQWAIGARFEDGSEHQWSIWNSDDYDNTAGAVDHLNALNQKSEVHDGRHYFVMEIRTVRRALDKP